MRAMVFAAGLGTRLGSYTLLQPKALVKLGDKSLLEWVLRKIARNGFNQVIINLHHYPEQIKSTLKGLNIPGLSIHYSDESDELLETGGGLKKASSFFPSEDKAFLIHNSDVISNVDLAKMMEFHYQSGAMVTLAVSRRDSSRVFYFDDNQSLCGWENRKTGALRMIGENVSCKPLAFSGIHIMSPEVLELLPSTKKFSLTDFYLDIAGQVKIKAYEHDANNWFDMGKESSFEQQAQYILKNPSDYI